MDKTPMSHFQRRLSLPLQSGYSVYRRLLWKIVCATSKTALVRTHQGIFRVVCGDAVIGKSLFCSRQFELQLMLDSMSLLRRLGLVPGDGSGTVIDVGANIGVISIGMLERGFFAQAVAIEPEPRNFALLRQNAELNGLREQLFCLPYAVSESRGRVSLELGQTNFGDHRLRMASATTKVEDRYDERNRRVIQVDSSTLDDLMASLPERVAGNVKLLWIDVQGCEGYVFKGGRKTLSTGIPAVAEVWPYGMMRAGIGQEDFVRTTATFWSKYWVMKNGEFVDRPISDLPRLFQEVGCEGRGDNVVFTA